MDRYEDFTAAAAYGDLQDATEDGAYGVAILLTRALSDLVVVRRSVKGTGFDYWLGPDGADGPPFQESARLEVSGTLQGSTAEVDARAKTKRKQVERSSALGIPAIVAIVDFARPEACLERVDP